MGRRWRTIYNVTNFLRQCAKERSWVTTELPKTTQFHPPTLPAVTITMVYLQDDVVKQNHTFGLFCAD